jgi:hypothetical protein
MALAGPYRERSPRTDDRDPSLLTNVREPFKKMERRDSPPAGPGFLRVSGKNARATMVSVSGEMVRPLSLGTKSLPNSTFVFAASGPRDRGGARM